MLQDGLPCVPKKPKLSFRPPLEGPATEEQKEGVTPPSQGDLLPSTPPPTPVSEGQLCPDTGDRRDNSPHPELTPVEAQGGPAETRAWRPRGKGGGHGWGDA